MVDPNPLSLTIRYLTQLASERGLIWSVPGSADGITDGATCYFMYMCAHVFPQRRLKVPSGEVF